MVTWGILEAYVELQAEVELGPRFSTYYRERGDGKAVLRNRKTQARL
jgi:hypothetical protein